MCPICNKSYNMASVKTDDGYEMEALLPKKDIHKCDKCDVKLVVRDDDKESIIKERMEIYKKQTEPILEFYKDETKVINFEAKKGINDYPKIRDLI